MLLTLSASCLRSLLTPGRTGKIKLDLLDLPRFAREDLGMHGLNISTALLAGVGRDTLDRLRDRADKAGCAVLLLVEAEAQPFGHASDSVGAAAVDRLTRVIQAGHFLGCSCVAVKIAAPGGGEVQAFERTADRLRQAMQRAERLEVNILISPTDGLTQQPEKVTELIKKIGGFRVGTFPDFQTAAATPNAVVYLRRLTPYAACVSASTMKFIEEKGDGIWRHSAYDLDSMVKAVLSVGYDGTLAVDYRGTGDARLGVVRSREALERLLTVDPRSGAAGPEEPVPEGEAGTDADDDD
jgi:hypothetical protein